ncbi:phospholipase-like protein [Tanacetum coccineum]|uniref:Phospholipase-like protein n=1 Tax=Tanacetum coccineum TaxID=301880 RepID=A0ABQ5GW24_9ASTR
MSTLSQFAFACNSIVSKEVLAVMFENNNEHDFNLVIDMHTKLNDLGMRIRQRAELILDVEKQGYAAEVFKSVKLLKDLQETDNAKARRKLFRNTCFDKWLDISFYDNEKQVFMDDAHYDMPLVYNVEGRFLHFGGPKFSLITGLHFGSYSFRKFKSGDVPFVSRVLPHKLGLKVSNLDLLGLIKDEELFGKLDDDDAIRVCLLLALEVIFIGKKLVDEVPDTLMRLVENLVVWNDFQWGEYIWRHLYDQIMNIVNKKKWEHLQGLSKSRNYVPTYTLSGFVWSFKILESFQGSLFGGIGTPKSYQGDWLGRGSNCLKYLIIVYYLARTPPTTYTDLFDDYIKKLSASLKRGKIDTRDLPVIRRCDTTSVEEIRLKDGVIAKLNSRVFKLEAIIKVLGRERKGVSLDKSCVAEFFHNFSSGCWEELNEEFNELCETKFCVNGPAMIDLDSDEDLVKEYLIQEESRLKQEEEERCHRIK